MTKEDIKIESKLQAGFLFGIGFGYNKNTINDVMHYYSYKIEEILFLCLKITKVTLYKIYK